jgi:hypothetical protein
VVKLLKEKYVCVALDARKERGEYKDADGDFVRATNCVTVTASGSICVVTAGGKALGPYSGPGVGMEKWLNARLKDWQALPETERAAGAVKVPKTESVDPKRAALALPPGTLIVRVFNRHLGWNADRSLRYVKAEDYLPNNNPASIERYGMAQNDFMWVPEKEWRALVPANPNKGDQVAVPASFALRLFRYHLDPCRGFSEGSAFQNSKADAGRLTLTVQEATPTTLRMQLQGTAKLQQSGREGPAWYEPAILGFLEYDRGRNAFTRFDILALGTAVNLPTDANDVVTPRKGEYPLGIAFELVVNPTPADRLHPRGARDNPAAYLEPKDQR